MHHLECIVYAVDVELDPIPCHGVHYFEFNLLYMRVGLKLQGAVCTKNTLSLSNTILTDLPLSSLKWVR